MLSSRGVPRSRAPGALVSTGALSLIVLSAAVAAASPVPSSGASSSPASQPVADPPVPARPPRRVAAAAADGDELSHAPHPGAWLTDPAALAAWLRDVSPDVVAAAARTEAATAEVRQAGVLPNPELDLAVGGFVLGATNPQTPRLGIDQTTQLTAGLSTPIELGKRGPRQRAAALRRQAAGEAYVGVLGARLGDSTLALGRVAYLAARAHTLTENLGDAEQGLGLEKTRLDKGDISGTDFDRLQLEVQRLEIEVAHAGADLRVATADCDAIVGASCAGVSDDALDTAAALPAAMPAVEVALEDRAATRALHLEAGSLEEDAVLAGRRRIPDPILGVSFTHDNLTVAGNQANTVLFSVGIPLPLFDRGSHDAAAARAHARETLADEQAARRDMNRDAVALGAQRASLEASIARLRDQSIPRSTTIVTQIRRSFDLGHVSLTDLVFAERAHRELLLALLDARYDLFAARVGLRRAFGLDDDVARHVAHP